MKHFGEKSKQQKEDSLNKFNQLGAYLTTTLNKFEQYNHHKISAYTGKEEVPMLKNEAEILK